jgi:predicted NBD/HSP70 family sugar kinase
MPARERSAKPSSGPTTATRPRTATTRDVTGINRTALIDTLREHGALSRRQLSAMTGLSSATVERISSALLAAGNIVTVGQQQSSGGRPSTLLKYSGARELVLAAEVGDTEARGILYDLDGVDRGHRVLVYPSDAPTGQSRLDGLFTLVEQLLSDAEALALPVNGIGVSVPGIVHEGKVMNTVELGWHELPLSKILETRHGVPVLVENDANAIAFGESVSGVAAGALSVASFVLGVGVGSGIVTHGSIHHGAHSAAGEVGYLFADRSALQSYFTDAGDLESRIAAVGRDARGVAVSGSAVRELIASAAAGDTSVAAAASELFDLVAFSCGAITTILDPEVVVLAGHFTVAPDYAIAEISRRLVGRIPFPPHLVAGSLGELAAVEGMREAVTRNVRGATYLR